MDDLTDLRAARAGTYWLRFGEPVEQQYARSAIRQRRYPLTTMFVIFGLSFLLVPLYQDRIFGVSPALADRLLAFQLLYTAPTMFAAAAVTYFKVRRGIAATFQALAVLAIWVAMLVLRRLSLEGQLDFPSSMVGIVVISVAIFGRFNWYRTSLGSLVVVLVASRQELHFQHDSDAYSRIYALVLAAIVGIQGAYVIEVGHRFAWLNGRIARTLACTDELTGLANRSEFNRLLPRLMQQACRERTGIAVAVFDVDHFKRVNDTHGHLVGDAVLKALGESLSRGVARGPQDLVVRFGGEELAIIWYDVTYSSLVDLVDGVLDRVRNLQVDRPGSAEPLQITASIGASWLIPDAGAKPEEVLRHADQLMYRAKDEGRDRALVASHAASGAEGGLF